MFYTDFYTKDEVIVQLEVWQESKKLQLLLKAPGAFSRNLLVRLCSGWVDQKSRSQFHRLKFCFQPKNIFSTHYFNNSIPGPTLQPTRFQSKLKSQLSSSVVIASLNQDLKSSIFVVQKATAPKSGVEFRQGSVGAIRSGLATSHDVWRHRATSQLNCRKIYTLTN